MRLTAVFITLWSSVIYATIDEFSWERFIDCYVTNVTEHQNKSRQKFQWRKPRKQSVSGLGRNRVMSPSDAFDLDLWCKAVFAVASLRNSSAQFFKPAWWSNFSKFSGSRVNKQVYLSGLCTMCVHWKNQRRQARFYRKRDWSLWTRSQAFATSGSEWHWQVPNMHLQPS